MKQDLKFKIWYHEYDIVNEKPVTELIEKPVVIDMPDDFGQTFIQASVESADFNEIYKNKYGRSFSKTSIDEQVRTAVGKLKLKPGYIRMYLEFNPDMYLVVHDEFRVSDKTIIRADDITQF